MATNHEFFKEQIYLCGDGETAPDERHEIQEHLSRCAECRRDYEGWTQLQLSLSQHAPKDERTGRFVFQVMERIHELEPPAASVRSGSPRLQWIYPSLSYTFVLIAMIGAIAYWDTRVDTESILLAEIPAKSHWSFEVNTPEVDQLIDV